MATAIYAKGVETGRGGGNGVAPAPGYVTYEEFLDQTAGGDFAEWEDGVIRRRDEVTTLAQISLGAFVMCLLHAHCEDNNAGTVVHAPYNMRLRQINRGREPDIAVVTTANLDRLTQKYMDGAADLAVEIVSPESETRDNETKFAEYEACGVTEYWVLDPRTQSAQFWVLDAATGKYAQKSPDASGVYESAVLPGFWINVAWLWVSPLPTVRQVLAAWDAGTP